MPRDLQAFRYAIIAAGVHDSVIEDEELREVIVACREEYPLLETEAFLRRVADDVANSLSRRSPFPPQPGGRAPAVMERSPAFPFG